MAKIINLRPSRDAAENERITAIGMKLTSAIAKAVVEDEPIDTAALLQEVEWAGQSVGLGQRRKPWRSGRFALPLQGGSQRALSQ
jgi:hypothetical protein